MEPSIGPIHEIRTKLLKVFRYLHALNQVRNPVKRDIGEQLWQMWLHDLPEHPTVQVGRVAPPSEDEGTSEQSDDFLLRVRRPDLSLPPEPPAPLLPWLESGWQRPDGPAAVKPTRWITQANGESVEEPFTNGPERMAQFDAWAAKHAAWVETERPARQALTIFDKLFGLQSQLQREGERLELLIGDGLLQWRPVGQTAVNHPMLLLRARLEFDPEVPEFTVAEMDLPSELYTALLRSIPEVDGLMLKRGRDDLQSGGWHPLGGEETDSFLKRLVSLLSPHGRFLPDPGLRQDAKEPTITRDPVFFVQARTQGFTVALESIIEDINTQEQFSKSLTNIVGIEDFDRSAQNAGGDLAVADNPNGEDEHVLLSKPANLEQLEIARRLERHGAVLVQGPPGTGKTHAIANLLGHLLAQGKSVLVTSHTAKALKVLRDKVVEPLQPLCVSVVDDTTHQLESSVDAITERLASSNADEMERQANNMSRGRQELLRQLRAARQRLLEARADEYRPVIVAGDTFSPAEAARVVAQGGGVADWIPAPLTPDEPLPLSVGDLIDLYRTNDLVTADDEKELALPLPDLSSLPDPADFAAGLAQRERLAATDLAFREELWESAPGVDASAFHALQDALAKAVEPLGGGEAWRMAAAAAGRDGADARRAWQDLISEIEAAVAEAALAQPVLFKHGPEVPDDLLPERIQHILAEIREHLAGGGSLGFMQLQVRHRDWKLVLEGCRVRGKAPALPDHFDALSTHVRLREIRADLVDRWERQMTAMGAPGAHELGTEPEQACAQFLQPIRTCLDWHAAVWSPLEQQLLQHGMRWSVLLGEIPPDLSAHGNLKRIRTAALDYLPGVLNAEGNRRRWARLEAYRSQLLGRLASTGKAGIQAEVIERLQHALSALDGEVYREAFQRLADLSQRRDELARRQALLARLEAVAPGWSGQIRFRDGVHGEAEPPGDAVAAWRWRQLNDELERRGQVSLAQLQAQIHDLTGQLQHLTANLVEKRAWAAQVRRTSLSQRIALQGWKLTVKKAGKGTGKRAPKLLAKAREQMLECQGAVPVWIMPLSRVVENLDPRKNRFDVVIIDEASQSDAMALIALYMGKQVVVVGDHQQVSPIAVGQRIDDVEKLIDEHLAGVPNSHLYDGQVSVYDLAQMSFEPICLREHFRCVAPIIQFSNRLSYDRKILPLRDASNVRLKPHTVAYRVPNATNGMAQQETEAWTVASLLMATAAQPEYTEATFGVIGMVGDEQALRIDTLLRRFMTPAEYARRKVQCGNAAEFQGDERTVMFLSMVDANTGEGPLSLRTEGFGDLFKKRFNVAASRAQDQMWVVHSLNPETDLKPKDLRLLLIQHAANPEAMDHELQQQEERVESEFERLVLRRLMDAGYRVHTQWRVGAYRIDMVVEGGGKRLAVECDGDRYHTIDDLPQDMARQAILERMDWRFVRIRGSQFFRDPEAAMRPVFERLRQLDIPPEGLADAQSDSGETELKERIIRRAAELRREWEESGPELVTVTATSRKRRFGAREASRGQGARLQVVPDEPLPDEPLPDEPLPDEPLPEASANQPPAAHETEPPRPIQATLFPDEQSDMDDAGAFLREQGVEMVDKRRQGGALWLIGGDELTPVINRLRAAGHKVNFAKGGGQATGNRDAWWTKSKF